MTAQDPDVVLFEDREHDLVGIDGDGPFHPADHDMRPQATSTACWRGFVCHYEVVDERLLLGSLDVNLDPLEGTAERRPPLNGVPPVHDAGGMFDTRYEKVSLALPFTGGLLIARDFQEELYVHMGFHPAWKYAEVHELRFEDGRLTSSEDVSAKMRHVREEMRDALLEPGAGAPRAEVEAWIERCFSRRYEL